MNMYVSRSMLCISLAALLACGAKPQEPTFVNVRPVQTVTVGLANGDLTQSFAADIKPSVEARMAFRVGGKIAQRLVDIGSTVKAGQALMRLDVADLQLAANASTAQVAAAKANDELAQADLKRTEQLAQQGFVSAGRLEQAQAQAKATRASYDAALASSTVQGNATQYAVLRADTSGVVTAVDGEVGQVVAAGTPMVRIAQGQAKDVVFSLPESMASLGKKLIGSTVKVALWSQPDATYTATVRDVAAIADPITRTFAVKASLKDAKQTVPLGATATVTLPNSQTNAQAAAVAIPINAVTELQGKPAVWVVEAGLAQPRNITLGAAQGENFQVMQGLKQGDVVVTAGVHTLTPGQAVKPLTAGLSDAASAGAAANPAPAAKP